MRMVKWNAFLSGLCGVAAALGVMAASARADVVTEKAAAVIVFPKVVVGGTIDTIIQISSSSNSAQQARCFYVDNRLPAGCTREEPQIGCVPIWQETDFHIYLSKQQPTHWRVGTGRPVDPTDDYIRNADGAGIDPGAVPPMTIGFVGELRCVEVGPEGNPIDGNHLTGLATLKNYFSPNSALDVSKYNAIGIQSTLYAGITGNTLLLNNVRGTTGGEYNACPQTLILNHFAEGALDPVIEQFGRGVFGGCTATPLLCLSNAGCPGIETCTNPAPALASPAAVGTATELTLVPCSENFETQTGGRVTVQFLVFNEFEERFSTSTTVACWKNTRLQDIVAPNSNGLSIFSVSQLGSLVAQTRITPADVLDGAVIGVAESTRTDRDGNTARAAVNIHTEGDRVMGTDGAAYDKIVLSDEF